MFSKKLQCLNHGEFQNIPLIFLKLHFLHFGLSGMQFLNLGKSSQIAYHLFTSLYSNKVDSSKIDSASLFP